MTSFALVDRSRETTLPRNLTDRAEIERHVDRFARELAAEAEAEGRSVTRVGLKLRYAPFFTRTRNMKLPAPTTDADAIAQTARAALDRFADVDPARNRPVASWGPPRVRPPVGCRPWSPSFPCPAPTR